MQLPNENLQREIAREIGYSFPESTRFVKTDGNLTVQKENGQITVFYSSETQIPRAALLLKAHGADEEFRLEDVRQYDDLCYLIDCSRNAVLKVDTVKKYIRNLSMLGYNALMLYTEETYEIEGEPIFGYLRGRYTKAELKEIDAYAKEWGIEFIPCIQVLAHLNALRRWYTDFEDLFDCDDILLVGDDKVYALIDKMFQTAAECFTTRRMHIGMDEAHNVGRGKYMDIHGARDTFDVLSEHLQKVSEIAKKYGFELMMWSDMFLNVANRQKSVLDEKGEPMIPQSVLDRIPDNVSVCHWDYGATPSKNYLHRFKMHQGFKNPVWMAVSSYKIGGFAAANAFSEHEMKTAFAACKKYGMRRIINCSWNDGGAEASQFANLPSVTNVSAYVYGRTRGQMKKEFFALTGYTYESFMKLEWPDNGCGKYTLDHVKTTKVMLYNDLLLGQYDTEVDENYTPCFEKARKAIKRTANGQYDYVFKNAAQICRVMTAKYEIGVRLRNAYKNGDKAQLKELTLRMDTTVTELKKFIKTLKNQWMQECKPYGFEIQEYRLGGLIERIKGVKARVLDYVEGKTTAIPELEETLYPDAWLGRNEQTGRMAYNSFTLIASVNLF